MVWHALGSYKAGGTLRKALVLESGSYDLDDVARALAPNSPFDGDILALIERWPEVVDDLAALAAQLVGSSRSVQPLPSATRYTAPFLPRRIFCAASNYLEHAKGMGSVPAAKAESEPYVFMKAESSIIGTEETILLPPEATKVDWEVELAGIIGRGGRNIAPADALEHVAAYSILNDITARDRGHRTDFPFKFDWFRGKSYDTFGPFGPWIVPSALVPDPQNIELGLDVDGEVMQSGSTQEMIFTLAEQISYISGLLTLKPGDVIATGTPAGTGMERGVFLKPGNIVTAKVAGIGILRNPVGKLDRQ